MSVCVEVEIDDGVYENLSNSADEIGMTLEELITEIIVEYAENL